MSVLDTEVANNVIYRTLENGNADATYPTLLTSMFTSQEIVDAMNRIQQKFLLDTGMIVTRTTIASIPNQGKYATPTDSIRPRRVTFTDTTPSTRVLTQADTWELDNGLNNWPYTPDPQPLVWWETTLGQQNIGIAPAPAVVGQLGYLYVQLATTLTGSGVALTVPDDWTPYIMWGTLSELLASDGPSFDPVRAQYCMQRYMEGVELANLVLGGS